MRDDAGVDRLQLQLQVGLRLGRAFRDRGGVVRPRLLSQHLDRTAGDLDDRQERPDQGTALDQEHDRRIAMGLDRGAHRTGGVSRGRS